jgi:hypothetical protein
MIKLLLLAVRTGCTPCKVQQAGAEISDRGCWEMMLRWLRFSEYICHFLH